jgi:hypothetical protein
LTAKITLDEAKRRVKNFYNGTIEIIEYNGIRESTLVKCLICENSWNTPSREIINGKGHCAVCNPIKRDVEKFSTERVLFYLEERGCELCDNFPKTFKEKINIKYPCGHINNLSIHYLKKNFGCKQCRINTFYINRYSKDDLINIAKSNGFEFMGFIDDYKDGNSIISYQCNEGHITNRMVKNFVKFPTCKQCKIISRALANRGDGSRSWKGGVSKIWVAARARLDPWVLKSLKEGNYLCCITGQSNISIDVHHLMSFNIIAKEVMREFGIDDENYYWKTYKECGEEVLSRIVDLNNEYGLGVCLRKDIHILYHKIYGHGNNTPSQFEEFKQRISSGEIIIPE